MATEVLNLKEMSKMQLVVLQFEIEQLLRATRLRKILAVMAASGQLKRTHRTLQSLESSLERELSKGHRNNLIIDDIAEQIEIILDIVE